MPARSIRPIIEGVDSTPSPPMCLTTSLSSTVVTISALSPGVRSFVGMSLSPVLSIRRLAVQIVTTRPGRRVAPMPGGTQPDSSRDDSIMTPGDATLGAQEVKEDLPKPADRRIMICARLRASAASLKLWSRRDYSGGSGTGGDHGVSG